MLKLPRVMIGLVKVIGENLLFLTAVCGLVLLAGGVAVKTDPASAAILLGTVLVGGPVAIALRVGRHV